MTIADIRETRLANQCLSSTNLKNPADIVSMMGCIQAQDYSNAKWAIALRLKNAAEASIERDFNEGKILRTHILRPTWHFVSPKDIRWINALTADRVKEFMKSSNRELGLDEKIFSRCNKILSKGLEGNKHLIRAEIVSLFQREKIESKGKMSHIMLRAELDGIVCSGAKKGNQFTYTLLEERVPKFKSIDREEGLSKLAAIYFSSHGPATVQDFAWWSGLTSKDAKVGLDSNSKLLQCETVEGKIYWMRPGLAKGKKPLGFLLPSYDEYIVAYKDRSVMIEPENMMSSGNGIFKQVIIMEGKVAGVWKRVLKKDHFVIETTFFSKINKNISEAMRFQAEKYAKFLGLSLKM